RSGERRVDRADQGLDPLDLPGGRRREQRLEVLEVLVDRPDRDAGPLGDAGRGRRHVAILDQREERVDDRPAGPPRPCDPTVDASADGRFQGGHSRQVTRGCTYAATNPEDARRDGAGSADGITGTGQADGASRRTRWQTASSGSP